MPPPRRLLLPLIFYVVVLLCLLHFTVAPPPDGLLGSFSLHPPPSAAVCAALACRSDDDCGAQNCGHCVSTVRYGSICLAGGRDTVTFTPASNLASVDPNSPNNPTASTCSAKTCDVDEDCYKSGCGPCVSAVGYGKFCLGPQHLSEEKCKAVPCNDDIYCGHWGCGQCISGSCQVAVSPHPVGKTRRWMTRESHFVRFC